MTSIDNIRKMCDLIEGEYLDIRVGEFVWHKTSHEHGRGVVLASKINVTDKCVEHIVSFSPGFTLPMLESELTKQKPFEVD